MTWGEQVMWINHEQMKQWNICNNNKNSSIEFQLKKGCSKFIPVSEKNLYLLQKQDRKIKPKVNIEDDYKHTAVHKNCTEFDSSKRQEE